MKCQNTKDKAKILKFLKRGEEIKPQSNVNQISSIKLAARRKYSEGIFQSSLGYIYYR